MRFIIIIANVELNINWRYMSAVGEGWVRLNIIVKDNKWMTFSQIGQNE